MSAMSTVTVLVARDHIPSYNVDLINCKCILVPTRGDGTPFDATSIQEVDIVKICVQLGCTHPKGVLRYSTMESVMLFHSADEMVVRV